MRNKGAEARQEILKLLKNNDVVYYNSGGIFENSPEEGVYIEVPGKKNKKLIGVSVPEIDNFHGKYPYHAHIYDAMERSGEIPLSKKKYEKILSTIQEIAYELNKPPLLDQGSVDVGKLRAKVISLYNELKTIKENPWVMELEEKLEDMISVRQESVFINKLTKVLEKFPKLLEKVSSLLLAAEIGRHAINSEHFDKAVEYAEEGDYLNAFKEDVWATLDGVKESGKETIEDIVFLVEESFPLSMFTEFAESVEEFNNDFEGLKNEIYSELHDLGLDIF
jgi:hypothetical protein